MAGLPQSPLLVLPGELRNMIYTFVAHSSTSIKLYRGDLVPPPLANTCRQIRREMSGDWYTEEAALDHTIPITAHLTTLDFIPLYKWLNTYDNRPAEQTKILRVLDIELALVSPPSTSPKFPSSSLPATKTEVGGYAKDRDSLLKTSFAADYKAILSCDSNWVKILDDNVLALGRATYGMDKTARATNPDLYSPTGRRRRFTETLAGNGYLTSCSTRIEYSHHPRVPILKNNNSTPSATAPAPTPAPAHPAFAHATSYLTLLTTPLAAIVPSTTCTHALCVRQLRRRIYTGLLRAQQTSQKLKWDRENYAALSHAARKVVRFYRLLDPLPKAKLNPSAGAFGKRVVVSGQKRRVDDVYAVGGGFGVVEGGVCGSGLGGV